MAEPEFPNEGHAHEEGHAEEHAAGAVHHHLAFLGDRAGSPVDERDTQLPFEPCNVGGDVRLHRVQRTSPGREAAVVGYGEESGELSEVHRLAR